MFYEKKEIIDAFSIYCNFLRDNRFDRIDSKSVETEIDGEEFLNFYNGNSQILNSLSNSHKLATMIFDSVARKTKESSGIWCYFGAVKGNGDLGNLESYHRFLDLETMEPRIISTLEYGDFCRNNSVIIFDKIYPSENDNLTNFLEFRNSYLSDISKVFLNVDLDKFKLDKFGKHYDKIVNNYKKLGRLTIDIVKDKYRMR